MTRGLSPATMAILVVLAPCAAHAQFVDDGSDAAIGKADTKTILELAGKTIKNATDAKVSELRRSKGRVVCGSVNVKNEQGLYLGERGFVVDLTTTSFGRVPEGAELLSPRDRDFEAKEKVRELYFAMCLD